MAHDLQRKGQRVRPPFSTRGYVVAKRHAMCEDHCAACVVRRILAEGV
jgi:hypothetical protein